MRSKIIATLMLDDKTEAKMIERNELRKMSIRDFKDGTIIVSGKYRICVNYGNDNSPHLHTTVYKREDLRDIPFTKLPKFIRDFIKKGEEK